MTTAADFRVGDRVAHIRMGDGVVVSDDPSLIAVKFDHKTRNGQHSMGFYDPNWFRINPHFLFHRSASTPTSTPEVSHAL